MKKRFLSIWFRYLTTDWQSLRQPELSKAPFVFAISERGRKMITAMNALAQAEGILPNMPVADAKALVPGLQVMEQKPGLDLKLLKAIGEWYIRYTPIVAVDVPNGLLLDSTGCSHLWGGEAAYIEEIAARLKSKGYEVRIGIADTIGMAWAIARFGKTSKIVAMGQQAEALLTLPPAALRLEASLLQRLHKLGLHQISSFMNMPRSVLRRRFGDGLLQRIGQALGQDIEPIQPIVVPDPYQERLPCLEPIRTAGGIEVAIMKLLEVLCERLHNENKGLRRATLNCYRLDGKIAQVSIGTNKASHHVQHLYKLFVLKIPGIRPGLGIELFTLDAAQLEDLANPQEAIWTGSPGVETQVLAELLDRLAAKIGVDKIRRFLPDEHHWPERSVKQAASLTEQATTQWRTDRPRPTLLLNHPELIEVTAPIPDYPPMSFRFQGKLHYIKKADGPERIEREWWIDAGEHRDYYQVEDEAGQRYWLFRSGHYGAAPQWFIHGFFA